MNHSYSEFDGDATVVDSIMDKTAGFFGAPKLTHDDLLKQVVVAKYCLLRVEENHYNSLPFHKVRGRLFDGQSKMYKV